MQLFFFLPLKSQLLVLSHRPPLNHLIRFHLTTQCGIQDSLCLSSSLVTSVTQSPRSLVTDGASCTSKPIKLSRLKMISPSSGCLILHFREREIEKKCVCLGCNVKRDETKRKIPAGILERHVRHSRQWVYSRRILTESSILAWVARASALTLSGPVLLFTRGCHHFCAPRSGSSCISRNWSLAYPSMRCTTRKELASGFIIHIERRSARDPVSSFPSLWLFEPASNVITNYHRSKCARAHGCVRRCALQYHSALSVYAPRGRKEKKEKQTRGAAGTDTGLISVRGGGIA